MTKYDWWQLADIDEPKIRSPQGLSWENVDTSAAQRLNPYFVRQANALHSAATKVYDEGKEDDGDAWGFVKDIINGGKQAAGWASDKIEDYNKRFVTPVAAWGYQAVKSKDFTPESGVNPLNAYWGDEEEQRKAEEVMSKVHPLARIAMEFVADPMFWGTVPLTMGGSLLVKASGASARAAIGVRTLKEAGMAVKGLESMTSGEKAAELLYNVGRAMETTGHIPDMLMSQALKPFGKGLSALPVIVKTLPGSKLPYTFEWGAKGAGSLARRSVLARTGTDLSEGIKKMGEVIYSGDYNKLFDDLASGNIVPEAKKLLTSLEYGAVSDVRNLADDIGMEAFLEKNRVLELGKEGGRPMADASAELAARLKIARAKAYGLTTHKLSEAEKLGKSAGGLYKTAMSGWVHSVLLSPFYQAQNFCTDVALAGPRAFFNGRKLRLLNALDPESIEAARAAYAADMAALSPSEIIYGLKGPELLQEMADKGGYGLAQLHDLIGEENWQLGMQGMIIKGNPIVSSLAALVQHSSTKTGTNMATGALNYMVNKGFKALEKVASYPQKHAAEYDATAWLGAYNTKLSDVLLDFAHSHPETREFERFLKIVASTPEFKALTKDTPQVASALLSRARRAYNPEDYVNSIENILRLPIEVAKIAGAPGNIPGGEILVDSINAAIEAAMKEGTAAAQRTAFNKLTRENMPKVFAQSLHETTEAKFAGWSEGLMGRVGGTNGGPALTESQAKEILSGLRSHADTGHAMADSLTEAITNGDLTAAGTFRELGLYMKRAEHRANIDRWIDLKIADDSLTPEELIDALSPARSRELGHLYEEARTQANAFRVELWNNAYKKIGKAEGGLAKGTEAAEEAWNSLAEKYAVGDGRLGLFDPNDLQGSKERLINFYFDKVDEYWEGARKAHYKSLGITEDLSTVPGKVMGEALENWVRKEYKNALNVGSATIEQGDNVRYMAKIIAEKMGGLTPEGAKARAMNIVESRNLSREFANTVMGDFYAGRTKFDDVASIIFPFVRWSTRAPSMSAHFMGRNPWFVPMAGRWLDETEKEQLPIYGSWLPIAHMPIIGSIMADPLRTLAPYQMLRPILTGAQTWEQEGPLMAMQALGQAGFYPGPLPQAVLGRVTGQPTSQSGQMFPFQQGVTAPLQALGEQLSGMAPDQLKAIAESLGLPEKMLNGLADVAYGGVGQDVVNREIQRTLVDMGYDPTGVKPGDEAWREAARIVTARRAIQFLAPVIKPLSDEQMSYSRRRVEALSRAGISEAEQIDLKHQGKSPWQLLNKTEKEKLIKAIGEEEFNRRSKIMPLGLNVDQAKEWYALMNGRAMEQTSYADQETQLAELGLKHESSEITGLEYRRAASEIKTNNYQQRLAYRKMTLGTLYGSEFVETLKPDSLAQHWDELTERVKSYSSTQGEGLALPEDQWLEKYQEIRPDLYKLPSGDIDWVSWRDAQAALLFQAGKYADYILNFEDRQVENLPSEQMYRAALDEYDTYNRIPKYRGITPAEEQVVKEVDKYADTIKAQWAQANPAASVKGKGMKSEQVAAFMVMNELVPTEEAMLWLQAQKKRYQNPQREAFAVTHPLLAHFGLVGAGTYGEMIPIEELRASRQEEVS